MNTLMIKPSGEEVSLPAGKNLIDEKMLDIIKKTVGRKNAITTEELLQHCFGAGWSTIQKIVLKQVMHRAIAMIKSSDDYKIFIMGRWNEDGQYEYFIPNEQCDVDDFKSNADERIKAIQGMKLRAQRSIDEKWYLKHRNNWLLR